MTQTTTRHLDPIGIRNRLGTIDWLRGTPHGPDGWVFLHARNRTDSIIVTCAELPEAPELGDFVHASIARGHMPTYEDLILLHQAVWPHGYAYQMFVPPDSHVNIHQHALHLWGALDGTPWLPDMGKILGTI